MTQIVLPHLALADRIQEKLLLLLSRFNSVHLCVTP